MVNHRQISGVCRQCLKTFEMGLSNADVISNSIEYTDSFNISVPMKIHHEILYKCDNCDAYIYPFDLDEGNFLVPNRLTSKLNAIYGSTTIRNTSIDEKESLLLKIAFYIY